ncbi:MAG: DUF4097 family beta strand repeat-containing protein [Gemmatimonadales bacterium]
MKWIALMLLLLASARASAQEKVQRTFAVGPAVSLRIWLPSGHVRVETWDKDSIGVVGSVAKGSTFFAGGGQTGAKLGVEQPNKRATTLANGDLVVTVPRRAQVFIKATNAIIETAHTYGDIELLTVGGKVTVEEAHGVVSIESIDAPIDVHGATGIVRLHNGGGEVGLRDVTGDLTVSTVRGGVQLTGESLGDAQIETVGGRVAIDGRMRRGAFIEVQTHDGNVSLRFRSNDVPLLELSSRGGEVSNGLGVGNLKVGRVAVRSFKGGVNAGPRAGVEGGKQRTNP